MTSHSNVDPSRSAGKAPCVACALVLALASLTSCSSETPAGEGPQIPPVLYVGAATDEALERMLAVAAKDVSTERLVIDTPAPDAVVAEGAPIVFSFHRAASARRAPSENRGTDTKMTLRTRSPPRSVLAWLSPVAVAHAHGTPFNGIAYYLVVSDASLRPQLRVFTDRTIHTLNGPGSTALRAAEQPLVLTLTSATFEENEVVSGGGPFLAGSLNFRAE